MSTATLIETIPKTTTVSAEIRSRNRTKRIDSGKQPFTSVMLLAGGKGKHSVAAQERAISVAKLSHATLTSLQVGTSGYGDTADRLGDLARAANVEYNAVKKAGLSFDGIIGEIGRGNHDLAIAASKDPRTLKEVLFGSSDRYLVRNSSAPVWIVRYRPHAPSRRIVVAVDPDPADPIRTELAGRLLELGSSLAKWDNSEIHVVNVVWPLTGYAVHAGLPLTEVGDLEKQLRMQQRASIDRFFSGLRIQRAGFHMHLLVGSPTHAIANTVSRLDADLLIIGSSGRSGLSGLVFGNTAEKVMSQVACSSLVVKPLAFGSAIALISSSLMASPIANAPRRDRLRPRKRPENPRPELWETSRKCNHGHLNQYFSKLDGDAAENNMDAASRRLCLMSFERHGEIYPNDEGADYNADAPAHHWDEFPSWLFLGGLLSSSRLRFTSWSPF